MDDHIGTMVKPNNRDKILSEGLRVVHQRGFTGASVRDIVQAAGVPQGSFTNHFASKEAFGLEILDIYFQRGCAVMAETLRNDALPPLARLGAYIDRTKARMQQDGMRNGCLFGNLSAEAGEHSDAMRARLGEIFAEVRASIAYCLKAAIAAGELPQDFPAEDIAAFTVSSLQGAILLGKTERSPAPIERFKKILFATILR